jgi:predicted HicB family RNase H-like nuclease
MATDNLHSIDERVPMDPLDVTVQLNIKVPYHYREQLIRQAKEAGLSLNRFCINTLIRANPPERR